MHHKLHIRGDSGRSLTITVHEYENPGATNPDDANWLTCSIEVSAGRFSGATHCSLMTYDFERLRKGLESLVGADASKATFSTDEDHLRVEFQRRRTGQVSLSGVLRDSQSGTSLDFGWDSDLSQMKAMLQKVKGIVAAFPVKESGCDGVEDF